MEKEKLDMAMNKNETDLQQSARDDYLSFLTPIAKFPLSALFIIFIVAILIAPTYPTDVTRYQWSCWDGHGPAVTDTDIQPPLIVLLNWFEWDDNYFFFGSLDGGTASHHVASPFPMIAYMAMLFVVGLWLLRRKFKKQPLYAKMDDVRYCLMFIGFLFLAIGIFLSLGLFMNIAFGMMQLPLNGWTLIMIFIVIAPAFLIISMWLFKKSNKLEIHEIKEDKITMAQGLLPVSLSVGIVFFLLTTMIIHAAIPQEDPPSVAESITAMSIVSVNNLSSTSVRITFGDTYRGNSASGLQFFLEPRNQYEYIRISWPEQMNGLSVSMICIPNNITATYHGQEENQNTPVINSGDYLIISNLQPGETYQLRVFNTYTESTIPVTGQTQFTVPRGN